MTNTYLLRMNYILLQWSSQLCKVH